jgi:hypothetical protein
MVTLSTNNFKQLTPSAKHPIKQLTKQQPARIHKFFDNAVEIAGREVSFSSKLLQAIDIDLVGLRRDRSSGAANVSNEN